MPSHCRTHSSNFHLGKKATSGTETNARESATPACGSLSLTPQPERTCTETVAVHTAACSVTETQEHRGPRGTRPAVEGGGRVQGQPLRRLPEQEGLAEGKGHDGRKGAPA